MFGRLRRLCDWRRAAAAARMVYGSECLTGERVRVTVPDLPWYRESASRMLEVADDSAARLEQTFGLRLPEDTVCFVTTPELAEGVIGAGVAGGAFRDAVVVGVPERHLSSFGQTVTHELAHLLSRSVAEYGNRFRDEGFACYASSAIGEDSLPCGLPLHYYLNWMLHVGIRPTLDELWERRDYSSELYDLAWSFASFAADVFGRERYLGFYGSPAGSFDERAVAGFGVSSRGLTRMWHEYADEAVELHPSRISRMQRWDGGVCSRSAWLKTHA